MKIFLALLSLTLAFLAPALAQTVPGPQATAALVCAYNSSPPAITSGNFAYVQCDASGHVISSSSFASVPFTGTGAGAASTLADASTFNGKSFDLRLNFGAPCTGSSTAADTAAFQLYKAAANASTTPTRLMIPFGTCTLAAQEYLFTKNPDIEGYSEYGSILQVASGADLSGISMIHANGGTSFVTRNMTYDDNNAIATSGIGIWLNINPNYDVVIDHVRMINGGTVSALPAQLFMVNGAGWTSCAITNSYFAFNAGQNTANQAINIGSNAFASNNCNISSNVAKNTMLVNFVGLDNSNLANNQCSGYGYGACIGSGPSTTAATGFYNVTVSNTTCRDTLSTVDVNTTYVQCVQMWIPGVKVDGTVSSNTCGPGISFAAAKSIITHSRLYDCGSCLGGNFQQSCIVSNLSAPNNGGDSTVSDNVAANVNTTNGTFGYSDASGVTPAVKIGVNDFSGMPSGGYNLLGAATFLQPTVIGYSHIPFINLPNGTFANNGVFTSGVAFRTTYAHVYGCVPANVIAAGVAAGCYPATCSSTTVCTFTNDPYTPGNVIPAIARIPASPTPFVVTGAGAYTNPATAINLWSMSIPKGMLGINGSLQVLGGESHNNSVGTKTISGAYGTYAFSTASPSTTTQSGILGGVSNRGETGRQGPLATSVGFALAAIATAMTDGAVDSTAIQTLLLKSLVTTPATDFQVEENATATFLPQ